MKAVRLKGYQQTASYRKPSSLIIRESYPLPPYSTVIGMIHTACDYREYHPMKISVSGKYYSSVSDAFTKYEFGNKKFETGRHQLEVDVEDTTFGINRGLGHIQLLVDVELLIYIVPEDESLVEEIAHKLLYPQTYLALGRHEDLLRVDEADIVELEEIELEDNIITDYDSYVPVLQYEYLDDRRQNNASRYRVNKVFSVNEKTGIRGWSERVDCVHLAKGRKIKKKKTVIADKNNEDIIPVFLA